MRLTEMRDAAMSGRCLYAARRPAQPGVENHGKNREAADGEFEPIGVDLGHHEAVVDDADQKRADDGAEHRAYSAGERGAADHGRGDRLELEPVSDRGQRRMQAENLDDAAE